ncbi:CHRD domain-containing protein [Bacillus gaemokensis]|uniref:CHRD domain-containing protein n=1 Tax=Bacillus gaemokensis TaxID=574375 RepID=A0A073K6Q2_9BACI|nr:CHRD domain-containing protein [Bacillus gaemokensis]KEK22924.1 hypothetical protein BAGA_15495 [Bacillus gaemokensis]KYG34725.1 hypothetical protein AZF08_10100 [Bacillus gaemokensis]
MFFSKLRGENEVPPVETNARGKAIFKLNQGRDRLNFKLELLDIENVVVAHLHLGRKGMNGPVVAFLFGPMTKAVSIECAFFTGTITQNDLVGPLAGQSLEDLVREICFENIYVNVHTVQNPSGEIRGQVYPC